MGGATGMVGDPSGKEAERALRSLDEIQANIAGQQKIYERILDFDEGCKNRARLVNNYDWFKKINFLDALRDIGKHFSVNEMIKRDSVRNRLENRDQGISFTEFSYMLIQAYDFLHLYRDMGVTIQTAGADQWGNIVSGADLIRRNEGLTEANAPKAFGITAPLITKADGGKFGKTEAGAVWLSPERTSPYKFYQFWINVLQDDVVRYLKIFTFLPREEIEALEQSHKEAPQKKEAYRRLAEEVTRRIHGEDALKRAQEASEALFSGNLKSQDLATLEEILEDVPSSEHAKSELEGEGLSLLELLPQTTLVKSKGEGRRLLSQNGIAVNGEKSADRRLTQDDLLHGKLIVIKQGKKRYHLTRWS